MPYEILQKERSVVIRDGVYVAEFISREDAEEWVKWKGGEVTSDNAKQPKLANPQIGKR